MIKKLFMLLICIMNATICSAQIKKNDIVEVNEGKLRGLVLPSGIRSFRGIPYALPPVGNLRWVEPQSHQGWSGIRNASDFGPRPTQKSGLLYQFRSNQMSEDCLYLNIWTGASSDKEKRPVYVFIHGGSFIHGDGSQPAYDGESMAKKGIIYITINYRLGIFGFFSHPELGKENKTNSSGNYGLLDQLAALKWIKANIKNFGGDPDRITLGGESVGAQSISALMASPLSRNLFSGAILESGTLLDKRETIRTRDAANEFGSEFLNDAKIGNINHARRISAKKLLKIASKGDPRRYKPNVDGYFFTASPEQVFKDGNQADIPILIGWNANEVPARAFFRLRPINPKTFRNGAGRIYGTEGSALIDLYRVSNKKEARIAGGRLASDWLINYSTWNLACLHAGQGKIVYRYLYDHPHPGLTKRAMNSGSFPEKILKRLINLTIKGTSFHASEIEYALGNLNIQKNYAWNSTDYKVSTIMQDYFVNFIKSGNPNSGNEKRNIAENWQKVEKGQFQNYLRINAAPHNEIDTSEKRFILLRNMKNTRYFMNK